MNSNLFLIIDYDLLLSNFRKYVAITDEEWQKAASLLMERKFKKGEFIDREGEVNHYTNLIESGSARLFYINTHGQEHVIQIGIRGWWIGDFPSFITQSKGSCILRRWSRQTYLLCPMIAYSPCTSKHRCLNVFFDC